MPGRRQSIHSKAWSGHAHLPGVTPGQLSPEASGVAK
jgi:hypothetical protein